MHGEVGAAFTPDLPFPRTGGGGRRPRPGEGGTGGHTGRLGAVPCAHVLATERTGLRLQPTVAAERLVCAHLWGLTGLPTAQAARAGEGKRRQRVRVMFIAVHAVPTHSTPLSSLG